MAIQLQQSGKVVPVINVTPLVDVVLVLLIIFMVIVPLLEKEMVVHLPADTRSQTPPPPSTDDQIIIDLRADGKVTVMGAEVSRDRLQATIEGALAGRERKVVFFAADDEARYGDAVAVLDAARGAGAETIGTVLSSFANR